MAKVTRRKIPELTSREFAEKYAGSIRLGMRVAVAFNLHKARGTEATPGEFIFTVREKAGGKVLAHVDEIALEHVEPKILPGSLRRIKERGVREVCCYLVGTVARPGEVPARGRVRLRFNPFKADCFTVDDGRCLEAAQFVLFTGGRRTLGVKVVLEGGRDLAELDHGRKKMTKQEFATVAPATQSALREFVGEGFVTRQGLGVQDERKTSLAVMQFIKDRGLEWPQARSTRASVERFLPMMGLRYDGEFWSIDTATGNPGHKRKAKSKPKAKRSSGKLTEAEKAANTRRLVSQIANGQARL
jgi:hypothetical protein